MKKFGVLLLVAAMAITVVASVAGCGGSKNKDTAKGYMVAGDAQYEAAVKLYKEMETAQTDAVTQLMGGGAVDVAAMNAIVSGMQTIATDMKADLAAAKVEYDKIISLTGVEDYVTYANLQDDIIAMYNDLLDGASKLLTGIVATVTSGGTLDIMALMQSPDMQNISEIGTNIQKLEKENKNFKSDKKLAD